MVAGVDWVRRRGREREVEVRRQSGERAVRDDGGALHVLEGVSFSGGLGVVICGGLFQGSADGGPFGGVAPAARGRR